MTELSISTKNCIVEQEGAVLIVTLNRPEAKTFSPRLLGLYKAWRLPTKTTPDVCHPHCQRDTFAPAWT
jgi:hypothetical protein